MIPGISAPALDRHAIVTAGHGVSGYSGFVATSLQIRTHGTPRAMTQTMTKTTTVHGLRDGQHTASTGLLTRKIEALGAKVLVAATGRVTVIDKHGNRHVYVLALDTDAHTSPLTQALADLEKAT